MALDINLPPVKNYIGTPYGAPISLCTPIDPAIGPKTVPLTIDWSLYGASSSNPVAVGVNLLQLGTSGKTLDRIRSVYIDNSFSPTPIYVFFPDTQFTVIAPPNSVVMAPVFVNDSQRMVIFANEFVDTEIPVTTIHVSNVPQAGFVLSTGSNVVTSPAVVYAGNAFAASAASVTQTVPNVPIGPAVASRTVLLAISFEQGTSTAIALSAVTVNGIAATIIQQSNTTFGLGAVKAAGIALVSVNLPAGTVATVVCTYSAALVAGGQVNVDAFAAYNLTSPLAAFSKNSNAAGAVTTRSTTLAATPAEGIQIAACIATTNPTTIAGIDNATADVHSTITFSRGYADSTGPGITPSVTTGVGCLMAIVAASFS